MSEANIQTTEHLLLLECKSVSDKRTYRTIASDLIRGERNYTFLNATVKAIEFFLIDHQLDLVELQDIDNLSFKIQVKAKHIQSDEINEEIQRQFDEMNEDQD